MALEVRNPQFAIHHLTNLTPSQSAIYLNQYCSALTYFDDFLYLVSVRVDTLSQNLIWKIFRCQPLTTTWDIVCTQSVPLNSKDIALLESQGKTNNTNISVQLVTDNSNTNPVLYLCISTFNCLYLYVSTKGVEYQRCNLPDDLQRSPYILHPLVIINRQICLFGYLLIGDKKITQLSALLGHFSAEIGDIEFRLLTLSTELDGLETSCLEVWNTTIYMAQVNEKLGFRLWTLQLDDEHHLISQLVIDLGAYNYSLSPKVYSIAQLDTSLYLLAGTIQPNAYGNRSNYTKQFEILRVDADHHWEIIAGTPRFSPDGLKIPFSSLGSNLELRDDPDFKVLVSHAKGLYLVSDSVEGMKLWFSQNANNWIQVPELSDQNTYYFNVKQVFSTAAGLVQLVEKTDFDQDQKIEIWLAH